MSQSHCSYIMLITETSLSLHNLCDIKEYNPAQQIKSIEHVQ